VVVFLHPDKWKLCADCGGSGLRGPGNCSGCKGRGYLVVL
jgi:DnaJ-class molecular chaperone